MISQREKDQISNVIRTLCRFYLQKGCEDFKLDLRYEDDYYSLSIAGKVLISLEEVDQVRTNLAKPASPEMSHYYDELLASGGDDEDMYLLGYLIEFSEVLYADGVLSLRLRTCCH